MVTRRYHTSFYAGAYPLLLGGALYQLLVTKFIDTILHRSVTSEAPGPKLPPMMATCFVTVSADE